MRYLRGVRRTRVVFVSRSVKTYPIPFDPLPLPKHFPKHFLRFAFFTIVQGTRASLPKELVRPKDATLSPR